MTPIHSLSLQTASPAPADSPLTTTTSPVAAAAAAAAGSPSATRINPPTDAEHQDDRVRRLAAMEAGKHLPGRMGIPAVKDYGVIEDWNGRGLRRQATTAPSQETHYVGSWSSRGP